MFFALALMTFTAFRPLSALERAAPASSPAVDAVLIKHIPGLHPPVSIPERPFCAIVDTIPHAAGNTGRCDVERAHASGLMMPDQPSADAAGALRGAVAAMLVYIGTGIGAQIYRFQTASNVVERQQIKLVGFAIGTLLGTLLLGFAVPALFIDISNGWFAWGMLATVPMFLWVPGLVAIAILRYQLFAIDHIISRTVAYAALTLVLALVYTSTVVVLGPIVGGNSQASVAGATLAVAVAARPARRRLQDVVDRHFNRRTTCGGRSSSSAIAFKGNSTSLVAVACRSEPATGCHGAHPATCRGYLVGPEADAVATLAMPGSSRRANTTRGSCRCTGRVRSERGMSPSQRTRRVWWSAKGACGHHS